MSWRCLLDVLPEQLAVVVRTLVCDPADDRYVVPNDVHIEAVEVELPRPFAGVARPRLQVEEHQRQRLDLLLGDNGPDDCLGCVDGGQGRLAADSREDATGSVDGVDYRTFA